ncbi:MAG: hypothetical protein BWY57_00876 [Betaproteobacteria bacterium ADurb.Bin341]|nr:MAG: hypothetical protein BWY57_00876 [Betaproteobacteria bacterium ADurb.Bin341]
MRYGLAVLLLLLSIAAQAETVTLAGRKIQVVLPAGYCKLDRSNPVDAEVIRVGMSLVDSRTTEVLAIFGACGELDELRRGRRETLSNYGQVLAMKTKGEIVPVANPSRQAFIKQLGNISIDSLVDKNAFEKATKAAEARYRKALNDENVALEAQRPSLLHADANAAYLAVQGRVAEEKDKPYHVFSVMGLTLVNGLVISINLCEKFKGIPPVSSVLARQQKAMAALVAANP